MRLEGILLAVGIAIIVAVVAMVVVSNKKESAVRHKAAAKERAAIEQLGHSTTSWFTAPTTPYRFPPSTRPRHDPIQNEFWELHGAVAGGRSIIWRMPPTDRIDGPSGRAPDEIVTGWVAGPAPDVPIRHDGKLFEHFIVAGADDTSAAMQAIDGGSGYGDQATFTRGGTVDGVTRVGFEQAREHRTYLGEAYSWNHTIFAVMVGFTTDDPSLRDQAEYDLRRMTASVRLLPR